MGQLTRKTSSKPIQSANLFVSNFPGKELNFLWDIYPPKNKTEKPLAREGFIKQQKKDLHENPSKASKHEHVFS